MSAGWDWTPAVAAWRLPTGRSLPGEPLADEDWARLLFAARGHRMTGLLAEAVRAGDLPTRDDQAAEADDAHLAALEDDLRLERALLRTVALLEEAGVTPRVLKGSAVAHLDYPDPALRSFGDVDLLVRPDDVDASVAALAAAGHRRRFPEPRPGFDRRFSKGASFDGPEGLEVDLHRTFAMGPYGLTVDLADVWSTSEALELGGRALHALDRESRFLHACYHAVLGDWPPRLVPLRDVAQLALDPRLDAAGALDRARRWRGEAVVARALTLAWDVLAVETEPFVAAWARDYLPPRADVRALAAYVADGSYAAKSLAALRVVPGWREKAAFAAALAFPRRDYVDGRHAGYTARWRLALRHARSGGRA